MYSNTAVFASSRVRKRTLWTCSVLSEAKKLSMGALCVPCQGALLSLVETQAGKLSLQPEALGADQEATNGLMWTALGRSI